MNNWIDVEDRMPKHGQKVLATYVNAMGNRRIIVGQFFVRWKEFFDGWEESDFEETKDEGENYYFPEGWYEQQDNWGEYSSIYVDEGDVTHWMPLPAAP